MQISIHNDQSAKRVSLELQVFAGGVRLLDKSAETGGIILTITDAGIDIAASYGGELPTSTAGRVITRDRG